MKQKVFFIMMGLNLILVHSFYVNEVNPYTIDTLFGKVNFNLFSPLNKCNGSTMCFENQFPIIQMEEPSYIYYDDWSLLISYPITIESKRFFHCPNSSVEYVFSFSAKEDFSYAPRFPEYICRILINSKYAGPSMKFSHGNKQFDLTSLNIKRPISVKFWRFCGVA
ncbi:hypothetical protein ACTA71_011372 [Dictyostelium dimigraforme]